MTGHKFDPKKAKHLHGSLRSRLVPAERILSEFHPVPDEVWAEAGAGTGFFTIPLAAVVREVYAIDVSEQMLKLLDERLAAASVANVKTMLSAETVIPLEDASVNAILMAMLVHELDDPAGYLVDVARAIKPGGRLCIVEFGKAGLFGPPKDHRVTAESVRGWAEAAGLTLTASHDWSRSLFLVKVADIVGWEFGKR